MTPVGEALQTVCRNLGVGFATAGSGNGGCVWALAEDPDPLGKVGEQWDRILSDVSTARRLPIQVDPVGLRVWEQPGDER